MKPIPLILIPFAMLAVALSSCRTFSGDPDLMRGMSKPQLIRYYFHCTPKPADACLDFGVTSHMGSTAHYRFRTPAEALRSTNLINANTWLVFKTRTRTGVRWLEVTFQRGKATAIRETADRTPDQDRPH